MFRHTKYLVKKRQDQHKINLFKGIYTQEIWKLWYLDYAMRKTVMINKNKNIMGIDFKMLIIFLDLSILILWNQIN